MRVLTIQEMEKVAGGGGRRIKIKKHGSMPKPSGRASSAHASSAHCSMGSSSGASSSGAGPCVTTTTTML